jgi:hypothetical protein
MALRPCLPKRRVSVFEVSSTSFGWARIAVESEGFGAICAVFAASLFVSAWQLDFLSAAKPREADEDVAWSHPASQESRIDQRLAHPQIPSFK